MKKYLLLLVISVLFGGNALYGQYDSREVPFYIDAEFKTSDAQVGNQRVEPNPMPLSAFKIKPGPERLTSSSSGVELVNMTPGAYGNQSETWITMDPNNPSNIIGSANDDRGMSIGTGFKMFGYYSTDAGHSFKNSETPKNNGIHITVKNSGTIFDPALCFNSTGDAYLVYGFTQIESDKTKGEHNGVFLAKSSDKGASWSNPYVVRIDEPDANVFNDRYTAACDWQPTSKYKDYVYVTWFRMGKQGQSSSLVCAVSEDGEEFNDPIELTTTGAFQAPNPAIGPDGEVYAVWRDSEYEHQNKNRQITRAVLKKSTNGGSSWSETGQIVMQTYTPGVHNAQSGRYNMDQKSKMRVSSVPYVDVDKSNGPRRGWVYVVMAGRNQPGGDYGIFLSSSSDGGKTWTPKKRIDNNELSNDMIFPAISVDPVSGNVTVFYYSSQNDPKNRGFDGYVAVSKDGKTFKHLRLTDTWYLDDSGTVQPQSGNDHYYWGDYASIVSYDNNIRPCFWMPTAANASAHSVDVFTAKIAVGIDRIKNISHKLVAAAKVDNVFGAGVAYNLTWDKPVKDMFGFDLEDYQTVVVLDGKKIATLDKGIHEYTADNLVSGQNYTFDLHMISGNAFGPKTTYALSAGGALKPKQPTNLVAIPHAEGIELTWTNPSTGIDNQPINGTLKVNIYNGTDLIKTVANDIQAGGNTSYILKGIDLKKFYEINISALNERGSLKAESVMSPEELCYAGAAFASFDEGFENASTLMPFFTKGKWGVTDEAAKTGSKCLADSPNEKYDNKENSSIIFAPVKITTQTTLSFDFIAALNDAHNCAVEISKDNGTTWKSLKWLNKKSSDKFTTKVGTSEFLHLGLDITEFQGSTVLLKLNMLVDFSASRDGFFIDDIKFDKSPISVSEDPILLSSISVSPNPILSDANVKLQIAKASNVELALFNVFGNKLITMKEGYMPQGDETFNLNAYGLNSGVYYLRLKMGASYKTVQVTVTK